MTGHPDRTGNLQERIKELEKNYFLPSANVLVKVSELPDPKKRGYRDEVVFGRMMAIDLQYSIFTEAIYGDGVGSNLTFDILGVGVGAAGAVVTNGDSSKILSAISGGIAGTKTAINENLFYEKTMPAMIALMHAEREKVRADILKGIQQDYSTYPLGYALTDIDRYFAAGTIPGAIGAVNRAAGAKAEEADEDVAAVRDESFVNRAAQSSIDSLLDQIDSLPAGRARAILQNPPSELDAATQALVRGRLGGQDLQTAAGDNGILLDETNAKSLLKSIVVFMGDRSEENLKNWEVVIKANQ